MIHHPGESDSNQKRDALACIEPRSQRTFTPSLAIIAKSAGIYHWTPEGRKLFDFTSGVLVTSLGHNPERWLRRLQAELGWANPSQNGFITGLALNAYNAVTPVEIEAGRMVLDLLHASPLGRRLERLLWAASGTEAVHKALWAALCRDPGRDMILATRYGFHGKKGLANAVTGSEGDRERDPRVRFISFPQEECRDIELRHANFDPEPFREELNALFSKYGRRIGALITEPYLGGGGSYHPPLAYHQMLQAVCREHDVLYILDEVQANFCRTGAMFAFEKYGVEPDLILLGKALGNGVPVAAVAGRADVLDPLAYGESSDTWSANPLSCAAVVATLAEYADPALLAHVRSVSTIIERELVRLKEIPCVAHVRGEENGMVWGVETCDYAGRSASDWANRLVEAAYRGDGPRGVHLLGPLAGRVLRIAPPLVITAAEATEALELLNRVFRKVVE